MYILNNLHFHNLYFQPDVLSYLFRTCRLLMKYHYSEVRFGYFLLTEVYVRHDYLENHHKIENLMIIYIFGYF